MKTSKYRLFAVAIGVILSIAPAFAEETILAKFNELSFDGWVYNRPSIEMNWESIAGKQICLFKEDGNLYHLTSPEFSCAASSTLSVTSRLVTTGYNNTNYDCSMSNTTMELLDENGNVCASGVLEFFENELWHINDVTEIQVPANVPSKVKLRFVAYNAERTGHGNSAMVAVRELTVTGTAKTETGVAIGTTVDDLTVSGGKGAITVNAGANPSAVYTIEGKMVSTIPSGKATINAVPGIYVVKSANCARKVIVR